MDKETIDYAIGKLDLALQKIAPTATELGHDMVSYTVFKATLEAILWFMGCSILGLISYKAHRYFMAKFDGEYDGDERIAVWVTTGIIAFLLIPPIFFSAYDAILANIYPLMFTIERLT